MYESDFMQDNSSFHPELLLLNELENLSDIKLVDPAIEKDENEMCKQNWVTNYPLLCYTANENKLVMVHMADKRFPTKEIKLDDDIVIISLVDSTQTKHLPSI